MPLLQRKTVARLVAFSPGGRCLEITITLYTECRLKNKKPLTECVRSCVVCVCIGCIPRASCRALKAVLAGGFCNKYIAVQTVACVVEGVLQQCVGTVRMEIVSWNRGPERKEGRRKGRRFRVKPFVGILCVDREEQDWKQGGEWRTFGVYGTLRACIPMEKKEKALTISRKGLVLFGSPART